MKAKEFGIYVDDYTVLIFTEVNDDYTSGVFWPSEMFEILTNKHVNDWIKFEFLKIDKGEVFNITPYASSQIISQAGYLGQVDEKIQKILKVLVRKLSKEQ